MFVTVLERTVSLGQHNLGTLLRTGWAYILILVALNFAIGSALSPSGGFTTVSYITEPVQNVDQEGLRMLAALANILIGFSIAIAYVRRILIDARDFPVFIGPRTFKVIVNQILLSLIGVIALIPLAILSAILAAVTGGLGALLMLAAPFIALMVVQRFSVILPAAAVDDPLTLKESWRATAGLGWAMAFSAFVMSLLAGCLIGIWALLLTGLGGLVPADPLWQHMRSAAFPMGVMLISVWVFASLHATFYGLIRERFAARRPATRPGGRSRPQNAWTGADPRETAPRDFPKTDVAVRRNLVKSRRTSLFKEKRICLPEKPPSSPDPHRASDWDAPGPLRPKGPMW